MQNLLTPSRKLPSPDYSAEYWLLPKADPDHMPIAVVVGASGGNGRALAEKLVDNRDYACVVAASRPLWADIHTELCNNDGE